MKAFRIEEEKLYSTGDSKVDELLERAFCEGYEYAQREYANQANKIAKNNYIASKSGLPAFESQGFRTVPTNPVPRIQAGRDIAQKMTSGDIFGYGNRNINQRINQRATQGHNIYSAGTKSLLEGTKQSKLLGFNGKAQNYMSKNKGNIAYDHGIMPQL